MGTVLRAAERLVAVQRGCGNLSPLLGAY